MELELKKTQTAYCKCICEATVEQGIDLELSLPDYCSDIKRILKCVVEPGINSVSVTGERLTAAGEITIRLIYVNDNEKIDCFEKKTELSKQTDLKGVTDGAVVLANASVEYVNCRAASQRRFNVSGTVAIHFSAYEKQKSEYLCGIDGQGSQTKTEKLCCNDLVAVSEKCFDMSETIALGGEKAAVGRILRLDACGEVQSLKAVSGKLLVKGELTVDILYCADTDSSELQSLQHRMPISQIADVADIDENSNCDVSLSVRVLNVEPRADSSGENKLLEIAAKLCAFVKAYNDCETEIITDCYSTKGELVAQKCDVDFCTSIKNIDSNKNVKKSVELSGQGVKEIIDIRAIKNSAALSENSSTCSVNASAVLSIIFVDTDGKLQYCERNIEFDFDDVAKTDGNKVMCESKLIIREVKASLQSDDKIEISFEAKLTAFLCVMSCKKVCTNATYSEDEEKESCALTICFSSKGDEIWKIAKKYKTTVKAVCEENSLKGETLEEDRMLMVPIV